MIDISRHPTDIFIDLLRAANPNLPALTKDDISTRNLTTILPPTTTEVDVDLLIEPSEVDGDYVTFEYERIDVDHLFGQIDQDSSTVGAQRRYPTDKQTDFINSLGLSSVGPDLHLHLLTKFGLNVGEEAKLVAHTEPDSYQLQFDGLVYTGEIEFLPDYRMVSAANLLANGYRFSHDNTGVYPAVPSELAGWGHDAVNDQLTYSLNSTSLVGIVTEQAGTHYSFKTRVHSDDASTGLPLYIIAAFVVDDQGVEHTISLYADVPENRPTSGEWGVVLNARQVGGQTLASANAIDGPFSWDDITGREVTVTRNGNILTITGDVIGVEPGTPFTYTVDLGSDARFSPFLGNTKFGYGVYNQALCKWKNIPV